MNTITDKLAEALRLLDNVTAAQDSEADYLGQAENLLRQALAEYDAQEVDRLWPVSTAANNLAQVDVLAVLDRTVLYAEHAAIAARKIEKGEPDCTLPKIKDAFQRIADNLRDAEQVRAAVAELVAAARGACNTLRESAKQHRLAGDAGHASHCETLADHTDAALRPFTGSTPR